MHMHEQDLELYVSERLPPSEMSTVESHLSACGVCRHKLSEAVDALTQTVGRGHQPAGKERRKEPRIATGEAGSVQSIVPFTNESLEVQILNVSRGGMKLHSGKSLDPGMMVKIRIKNVVAFGEVRYCTFVGIGYTIGIKIENVYP